MYFSESACFVVLLVVCASTCMAAEEKKEKTLTCYSCSSNTTDAACVDGSKLANGTEVETCTGVDAVCMKIFSHVYGISGGDSNWDTYPPVVSRFCAKDHPLHEIGCVESEGIKGKQVICLCDDKDRCNAAHALVSSAFLLSLALLFSRLL